MGRSNDPVLLDALEKAYTARAKLFHQGVKAAKVDLLIAEIDGIDGNVLEWSEVPGVSGDALDRLRDAEALPHQVFAHPRIIVDRPHLIAYYRNLATLSQKGVTQLIFSTSRFEARKRPISKELAVQLCKILNSIITGVIEEMPTYSVELGRQAIIAEIGTELQGTWANTIGNGAAKAVADILDRYIEDNSLGVRIDKKNFDLANGWKIRFAAEPDVVFVNAKGVAQIAIEIKGSLDVAGAQTRYGEAKKSFAKALVENPRCHTIYLASCYTDGVLKQIEADGQVRTYTNLTSVLYDDEERDNFLKYLFHLVNTPTA